MLKKKVKSILCALMVTSIFSGTIATTMNINKVIAEAITTIQGLQTNTGVITGKVKLKNTFPTDESLFTVDYLKTISVSVNPKDNPDMFAINITEPIFSVQKNYLTDKIYHFGRIYTFASGRKKQMDDFYKILSLEKAERQGYVTVTFASAGFVEGEFVGYGEDTATYENKTAYAYLVSEEKEPEKPPNDGGTTENKAYSSIRLGGTGVVSDDIITNLKSQGFNNFKRLGGLNRYETNQMINNQLGVATGTPVIIASGLGFADALSISSISGINNMPIYLANKDSIDSKSLADIKNIAPSKIYIVGGTGVISSNV